MSADINPTGAYAAAIGAIVAAVDPLDPFDTLALQFAGLASSMDEAAKASPAFGASLAGSASVLRTLVIPALQECGRRDRMDWGTA